MKPTLYILCGPPACGKTTWANNFIREHEKDDIRYVSRDLIRFSVLKDGEDYFSHEKEVYKKFISTITQTLIDGFDVIADATHLNKYSRQKLTNSIDVFYSDYNIIYVIFDIPFVVCAARNNTRVGRMKVPMDNLSNMYENFSFPQDEDKREIDRIIVEE